MLRAELVMKARDTKDENHVPIAVRGIVCVADFKDVKDKDATPVTASYKSFAKVFADSGIRGRVGKAARKSLNYQKDGTDADEFIANHLAEFLRDAAVPPSNFKHLVPGDTDIVVFQTECGLMNVWHEDAVGAH